MQLNMNEDNKSSMKKTVTEKTSKTQFTHTSYYFVYITHKIEYNGQI